MLVVINIRVHYIIARWIHSMCIFEVIMLLSLASVTYKEALCSR